MGVPILPPRAIAEPVGGLIRLKTGLVRGRDRLPARRLAHRITGILLQIRLVAAEVVLRLVPIASERRPDALPCRGVVLIPPTRLPQLLSHSRCSFREVRSSVSACHLLGELSSNRMTDAASCRAAFG